jgi:hypothetical protein
MALVVNRPCYVTREEVMRAMDIKAAAYNSGQVDRQLLAASESAESLCKRNFYVNYTTHSWDWPNFQYAYPWRLWLDQWELAANPTAIISGPYLTTPVVIPVGDVLFQPVNQGPPFRWIELRRDLNDAFGNNTTPQNDIQITGPFGYWLNTFSVGSLSTAVTSTTQSTVQMSVGSGAGAGVGDTLIIGTEQMIVQDANFVQVDTTVSGLTSNPPSKSDVAIGVANGANYTTGETLIVDSEAMLIQFITGNTLTVQRAWDGSVLSPHAANAPIYAKRLLTVLRGQLGTTAATYTQGTAVAARLIPGVVKEYSLAVAMVGMIQEPSGYTLGLGTSSSRTTTAYGGSGRSQQREPIPGVGLAELEDRLANSRYARKVRKFVI